MSNEELKRREKVLKTERIIMIILDVLALIYLVFQIITKEVTYVPYIILILVNILTFSVKIDK